VVLSILYLVGIRNSDQAVDLQVCRWRRNAPGRPPEVAEPVSPLLLETPGEIRNSWPEIQLVSARVERLGLKIWQSPVARGWNDS
jgi:hypothetical protein